MNYLGMGRATVGERPKFDRMTVFRLFFTTPQQELAEHIRSINVSLWIQPFNW